MATKDFTFSTSLFESSFVLEIIESLNDSTSIASPVPHKPSPRIKIPAAVAPSLKNSMLCGMERIKLKRHRTAANIKANAIIQIEKNIAPVNIVSAKANGAHRGIVKSIRAVFRGFQFFVLLDFTFSEIIFLNGVSHIICCAISSGDPAAATALFSDIPSAMRSSIISA